MENKQLLRIYLSEHDQHQGRWLHEIIVDRARQDGIAGATVIKGLRGYGCKSDQSRMLVPSLSEDSPIVIEIIDSEMRLKTFLSFLQEIIQNGLVTLEPVTIALYRKTN